MAAITKSKVIDDLTRKYLKRITDDCIELSPLIEDAFEIRAKVINKISLLIKYEERR